MPVLLTHSARININENWPKITRTHPFNGPYSGTTKVSRYQKGKTSLDFTEARNSEWQWHQLGHIQVCTLLQTDNHASTPPLSFFTGWMSFLLPNQHSFIQRQSTELQSVLWMENVTQQTRTCSWILSSWNRTNLEPRVCRYSRPPDLLVTQSWLGHVSSGMNWDEVICSRQSVKEFWRQTAPRRGAREAPLHSLPRPQDGTVSVIVLFTWCSAVWQTVTVTFNTVRCPCNGLVCEVSP